MDDRILELKTSDELAIPDCPDGQWDGVDRRGEDRGGETGTDNEPVQSAIATPSQKTVAPQNTAPSRQQNSEALCLSFMGVSGGVGVTSICVDLAYAMSRKATGPTRKKSAPVSSGVCVIDMDFDSGSCAQLLDLTPALTHKDLQTSADRIDRSMMAALAVRHESGLELIACDNAMGGNDDINADTVVAILDQACQIYQTVIIDIPRYWRPWNAAAIAGADRFSLVTDLTIPSLHLAQTRLTKLRDQFGSDFDCEILLSKFERRSFRNALRIKDAEKALGKDIQSSICYDIDTLRESINSGHPAGAVKSESRYAKDIRSYLEQLETAHSNINRAVA